MSVISEIIYPARCSICDDCLDSGIKEHICPECRKYLKYITDPVCMKCGKELISDTEEYCFDCSRSKKSFVRGYPLLHYASPVKESISRMKYEARQEYAEFYGEEIALHFREDFKRIAPDVLIPVPVSSGRMRKRGYNQAALLAEAIGRRTGIPVDTRILIRRIDTLPQKKLGNEERIKNLLKAFAIRKGETVPKKVLLVDDIYTTGSTVEACSRVLLSAGAEQVFYTSVAIGTGS